MKASQSELVLTREAPDKMPSELRDDNLRLTRFLRGAHELCAKFNDVASTSLIERTWFLGEIVNEL